LPWCWGNVGERLYQSFVFCKEYGDAGVDLADCEGDEHRDAVGKSCEGVRFLY
jgi:hypothetical protein